MHKNIRMKTIGFLLLFSLLVAAYVPVYAKNQPIHRQIINAQDSGGLTTYLPLIVNKYPSQTIFGVQSSSFTFSGSQDFIQDLKPTWARGLTISWAAFEPTQGAQVWSSLAGFEQNLASLQSQYITPIVTVTGTPTWAQKRAGYTCGPIQSANFADFARFLNTMVTKYSKAPYFIRYWEIWNEPDVQNAQPNDTLGCWGDTTDANYGGGYYGQMLQAVYPIIKQADPNAQVLVGGLLLDCDPNLSSAATNPNNPGCISSRFLNGILAQGAGSSFDGISFHAYDYYSGSTGQYSNTNWGSGGANGPVLIGKANYIKKVLADNNVSGKYLLNTEVALILGQNQTPPPGFETTKAGYVGIAYSSAIAAGLRANIWYSLTDEWRYSGLLDGANQPLDAYTAYQFARKEIGDATYSRAITNYAGVMGYEFINVNRVIWVLWAPGGSASVNLPAYPQNIYDDLGNAQTLTQLISVSNLPIYIEMQK